MRFGKKKQKQPESSAAPVDEHDLLERLENRDLLDERERSVKRRMRGRKATEVDKDLENAKKLFEGGDHDGGKEDRVITPEEILKKTPEEVFKEMDLDGSGSIDFDEFKQMLPKLGVTMTEAKASRYFKSLDTDGSGELGIGEFKAALFACDKNSGNSIGFSPSALMTPKDAFKLFDEDESGRIDEDEFGDVLEFLGLNVTQEKQEKFFKKYDKDKSGYIEYNEFRKIWLSLADVRGELEKRGVTFGKRTPKIVMVKRLEELIDEEEQMEEFALAQAKAYRDWQMEQEERKAAWEAAKARAKEELRNALDSAGQVYVFGVGAHGQFSADSQRPSKVFKSFDTIQELWKERVMPKGPVTLRYRNIGQVGASIAKRTSYPLEFGASTTKGKSVNTSNSKNNNQRASFDESKIGAYDIEEVNDLPGRDEGINYDSDEDDVERESFRFPKRKNFSIANKIARGAEFGIPEDSSSGESDSDDDDEHEEVSDNDDEKKNGDENDGEEGKNHHTKAKLGHKKLRIESRFNDLVCAPNACALWGRRVVQVSAGLNTAFGRTDDGQLLAWGGRDQWWILQPDAKQVQLETSGVGKLTQRSQLMLSLVNHDPWPDVKEPDLTLEETEDEIFDRLKFVTHDYYGVYEPSPHQHLRMEHMENIILAKLSYEEVALTLTIRGFDVAGLNKRQMIDKVHQAIIVERDNVGWKTVRAFRQAEIDVRKLHEEKKAQRALVIESTVKSIWRPLLKKVDEWNEMIRYQRVEARDLREKMHTEEYLKWRESLQIKDSNKRLASVNVVTERGNGPKTFRRASMIGFKTVQAGSFHVAAVSEEGLTYTWGDGNYGRLAQGQGPTMRGHMNHHLQQVTNGPTTSPSKRGRKKKKETVISHAQASAVAAKASASRFDVDRPTLVQDLAHENIETVSCGFSHSAAIVSGGNRVYVWGNAMDGKLGLGYVSDQYEMYAPYPVCLNLPITVKQISCSNSHTACVTSEGHLYVWGCSDSGRLGLGNKFVGETVDRPTLVDSLKVAGVVINQVSCGTNHTAAISAVRTVYEGTGANKIKKVLDGHVYVAGPASVLGKDRLTFHLVKDIYEKPMKQISCGYNITGAVTVDGEVYTWGMNRNGCLGHSIHKKFVPKPKLVQALYRKPKNLALRKKTRQSSVYNSRTSEMAVNGDITGDGERFCIHTQVDAQPFWEVDLGSMCVIEKIVLWNRTDSPPDQSSERDQFTKRLFPCWVMVSPTKMDDFLVNAHSQAIGKKKFTKNRRRSEWILPSNVSARYVRVQLEKINYLHFAELQVFGTRGTEKNMVPVSSIECGKEVTIAVIDPSNNKQEVENAYLKAVRADPNNAFILRQYPTFFKLYDTHGFGEKLVKCPNCHGTIRCEMCLFKNKWQLDYGPGPNGRKIRRLDSMGNMLMEEVQPPMNWELIKNKNESVVGNVLAIKDFFKGAFSKSGAKLMGRQVALERFGITLHEADISTNYLLKQFEKLKKEDEEESLRAQEDKQAARSKLSQKIANDKGFAHQMFNFGCVACSRCDKFEPLLLNKSICKTCTHVKDAHTRKVLKTPKFGMGRFFHQDDEKAEKHSEGKQETTTASAKALPQISTSSTSDQPDAPTGVSTPTNKIVVEELDVVEHGSESILKEENPTIQPDMAGTLTLPVPVSMKDDNSG